MGKWVFNGLNQNDSLVYYNQSLGLSLYIGNFVGVWNVEVTDDDGNVLETEDFPDKGRAMSFAKEYMRVKK